MSLIEPLEARIAPATFVNTRLVTYVDPDGDTVAVSSSKPVFHSDLREFVFFVAADGEELQAITLEPAGAAGTNLRVAVTGVGTGGDGRVFVGAIHAPARDLGSVTVLGDLGRIDVGDSDRATPALAALSVANLGRSPLQLAPQDSPPTSLIEGGVAVIRVSGDVRDAVLEVRGRIGSMQVSGDFIRTSNGGGFLLADDIGALGIGGDFREATLGVGAGAGGLSSLVIGGSVVGGDTAFSGRIGALRLGVVRIAGDVIGGDGFGSGTVESTWRPAVSFELAGSLIGGEGRFSGQVALYGGAGAIAIGGDVIGGAGESSGVLSTFRPSQPESVTSVATLRVAGSVLGGTGFLSGQVAVDRVGTLSIVGDVVGGSGGITGLVAARGVQQALLIGGGIYGGDGLGSDGIVDAGNALLVRIGSGIHGSGGSGAGILFGGRLGAVQIIGGITGGDGHRSGSISAVSIPQLSVVGDIAGGVGGASGSVHTFLSLGSVRVVGSVVGGNVEFESGGGFGAAGAISSEREIASLIVTGSITGGSSGFSGSVLASGRIGMARIGGNLAGGEGANSGTLRAGAGFGTIAIGGSILGGDGGVSGSIRGGFDPVSGAFFDTNIESVSIGGDVRGGDGTGSGSIIAPRRLASLIVQGSVAGGAGDASGVVAATAFGAARIGTDVLGGSGSGSGKLISEGAEKVSIDGSVRGGAGLSTGAVEIARLGELRIGGDVAGGAGFDSGYVQATRGIGVMAIGSSLSGGSGPQSGYVAVSEVGTLRIGSSVLGTRTDEPLFSGSVPRYSGAVLAGTAGVIEIAGSVRAGERAASEAGFPSYAILVGERVGRLAIGGELAGTETNPIALSAGTQQFSIGEFQNRLPASRAGFGTISIGGGVANAEITAGWAQEGGFGALNPEARIDQIVVRGGWTASSLAAGVDPGADRAFGTLDDRIGRFGAAVSAIGRIVVVGRVAGTAGAEDFFAFTAGQIVSASVGGLALPLTAAVENLPLAPATGDVRLVERGTGAA